MSRVELEFTNPELVTYVIYNLGGSVSPIDLEDIALAVFQIAPNRFCWKKYQEMIDLRIVNYALNDAKKLDIGYVLGNPINGYMLTEKGTKWVLALDKDSILVKTSRKQSISDVIDKEIDRLRRTSAFAKYKMGEEDAINDIDFREFTRVNDNFPKSVRLQRLLKIQNSIVDNKELSDLWGLLSRKFLNKG
jgi:hypothetical protein